MEEKEPKENDLLQRKFEELTQEEQVKFFELAEEKVYKKYEKIISPEIKGSTHTIVLENGLGCIIRKPNAKITGMVLNKLSNFNGEIDSVGAGKIILENCWVCGDQEVLDNPDFALFAGIQCVSTVKIMQGSIKKN